MRSIHCLPRLLVGTSMLSLFCLATGCSSSSVVTGKVTYQGRALTGGTVLFTSTAGKGTQTAEIGSDGSYTIKMPPGPVKIAVDTRSAQAAPSSGKGPPKNMQPGPGVNLPPAASKSGIYGSKSKTGGNAEPIPENYADPEKSGLTYTVTSGSQTHPIDLK